MIEITLFHKSKLISPFKRKAKDEAEVKAYQQWAAKWWPQCAVFAGTECIQKSMFTEEEIDTFKQQLEYEQNQNSD